MGQRMSNVRPVKILRRGWTHNYYVKHGRRAKYCCNPTTAPQNHTVMPGSRTINHDNQNHEKRETTGELNQVEGQIGESNIDDDGPNSDVAMPLVSDIEGYEYKSPDVEVKTIPRPLKSIYELTPDVIKNKLSSPVRAIVDRFSGLTARSPEKVQPPSKIFSDDSETIPSSPKAKLATLETPKAGMKGELSINLTAPATPSPRPIRSPARPSKFATNLLMSREKERHRRAESEGLLSREGRPFSVQKFQSEMITTSARSLPAARHSSLSPKKKFWKSKLRMSKFIPDGEINVSSPNRDDSEKIKAGGDLQIDISSPYDNDVASPYKDDSEKGPLLPLAPVDK